MLFKEEYFSEGTIRVILAHHTNFISLIQIYENKFKKIINYDTISQQWPFLNERKRKGDQLTKMTTFCLQKRVRK